MNMNKIIIWEDLNLKMDLQTGMVEDVDNDYTSNEDSEYYSAEDIGNIGEIITTPMGIFNVKDYFNPMSQYNWHMAHTNFNITKDVATDISKIEGVEFLKVISRYRFLIATGKAFVPNLVKQDIYRQLDANAPLSEEVYNKLEEINHIYDNWCLFFLDEEVWEYTTEADDNFKERFKELQEKQKVCGGIILTNETNI